MGKPKKKAATPTAAEFRVAEDLRNSPGGPEWIRRSKALTEGEAMAFAELSRRARARPVDPRFMQAVITAVTNPLGVLDLPALRQKLERQGQGRSDAITHAVADLARDSQHEKPRALWDRLAVTLVALGWRLVELSEDGEAELHDAHGDRLTYPMFKKRLDRAKKKRPPAS